jgi:hypothetical protein
MPVFPAVGPAVPSSLYWYGTLAQLKNRLGIASAITTHDVTLEAMIEASSRRIDMDTGRVFYATTTTRYYTPQNAFTLIVPHDILSVTEVAVESTNAGGTRVYGFVLGANEYDLEPYDGPPFFRIVMNEGGRYAWPRVRRGAKITGTFGYSQTGYYPGPINEACLRMAARLFERNKAPLGFVSANEFGSTHVSGSDPDYNALIFPYKRIDIVFTGESILDQWELGNFDRSR